ncbi:PIG-L deacetylase family protein [Nocardia callitridis]|uniref:PIG-L family deacetylase n=1 Tax=Nocardia callitridis TaxID=648753 RepID=A0ABP9K5L1_9NOCA
MVAESMIELATRGTPEQVWSPWRQRRPELSLCGWRHLVVVAAHPDDEILGAGGLIALARARGLPVTVVAVTDGEAADHGHSCTPAELAELRADESCRAASELDVAPPVRLRMRDGKVAATETATTEALVDILADRAKSGAWCATNWRRDGHPDHEAVGRATAAACAATATRLLEFPVWMWHWATPDHPVLRTSRARTVTLSPTAIAAKRKALGHFRSQTCPMSDRPAQPPHELDRFSGATETFFV